MTNQTNPVKRDKLDSPDELKSYRVHLVGFQEGELVAYEVTDNKGAPVWTGPTAIDESAIRELDQVRQWLVESNPADTLKRLDERIAQLRNGGMS